MTMTQNSVHNGYRSISFRTWQSLLLSLLLILTLIVTFSLSSPPLHHQHHQQQSKLIQLSSSSSSSKQQSRSSSSPLLLVNTLDGKLHAIDTLSNQFKWSIQTRGGPLLTTSFSQSYMKNHHNNDQDSDTHFDPHDMNNNHHNNNNNNHNDDDDSLPYYVIPSINGNLYVHVSGIPGLQKMPITVREFVDMSPFHAMDGTLYISNKKSHVFVLNGETGQMMCEYNDDSSFSNHHNGGHASSSYCHNNNNNNSNDNNSDNNNNSTNSDTDRDNNDDTDSTHRSSSPLLIYMVRVDYVIHAMDSVTGSLKWNITFSDVYPSKQVNYDNNDMRDNDRKRQGMNNNDDNHYFAQHHTQVPILAFSTNDASLYIMSNSDDEDVFHSASPHMFQFESQPVSLYHQQVMTRSLMNSHHHHREGEHHNNRNNDNDSGSDDAFWRVNMPTLVNQLRNNENNDNNHSKRNKSQRVYVQASEFEDGSKHLYVFELPRDYSLHHDDSSHEEQESDRDVILKNMSQRLHDHRHYQWQQDSSGDDSSLHQQQQQLIVKPTLSPRTTVHDNEHASSGEGDDNALAVLVPSDGTVTLPMYHKQNILGVQSIYAFSHTQCLPRDLMYRYRRIDYRPSIEYDRDASALDRDDDHRFEDMDVDKGSIPRRRSSNLREGNDLPLIVLSCIVVVLVVLLIRSNRRRERSVSEEDVEEETQDKQEKPIEEDDNSKEQASTTSDPSVATEEVLLEYNQVSEVSTENIVPISKADNSSPEEDEYGYVRTGKFFISKIILGKGSNGTVVYEGKLDGRRVAIKRMLREFYDEANREIELLIESDEHSNVVRYFAKEEDSTFIYLALEYCPFTLADLIENSGSGAGGVRENFDGMNILVQLIQSVVHIHSLGIVHRDLKPQNILVTSNYRVKLSDMGLGKRLDKNKSSFCTSVAGTLGWQAPELLRENARTTKAVDIFALGCMVYYVLSKGQHPFGDGFQRDNNILKSKYNLSHPNISLELADLIESMICNDPGKRVSASAALQHPSLWSDEVKLNFLCDVSDQLGKEKQQSFVYQKLESLPLKKLIFSPNKSGASLLSKKKKKDDTLDWSSSLDDMVLRNVEKFRRYDHTQVWDLLRLIRNIKSHYREYEQELQDAMKPLPGGIFVYFSHQFPNLFFQVYTIVKQNWSKKDVFQHYFPHK